MFVPDLFFNVVVACSIIVCSAVAVTLAWTGRLKANTMPYVLPTALLLAGNLAALLGVVLSLPPDLALLVPGLLYGAGSVMLSLFWIEVLSASRPSSIVVQIA
ncbi:MAG: LuxR family transcriptional regulator, partial [Eggerthella sp.]|nr:LuxR family transcriptional regulator [Eggerthella sp.]